MARRSALVRAFALGTAFVGIAVTTLPTSSSAEATAIAGHKPVVVELFQSQGCSDCPPALANLNRLADRPDVLALSYGVTYWDYLGWKDSFASPAFTQRQRDYSARNGNAGVATPQYWINGRSTVLGANPSRVASLIANGPPQGGPDLQIKNGSVQVSAGTAPKGGLDVVLVRYDPRVVQVAIRAGENGGRTLPHRNIVHQLVRLGRWSGRPATFNLPAPREPGLKEAVLVQDGSGGPILSALKE